MVHNAWNKSIYCKNLSQFLNNWTQVLKMNKYVTCFLRDIAVMVSFDPYCSLIDFL